MWRLLEDSRKEGERAADSRSTVATVPRRKKNYKSGVRTSPDRISNRKAISDQKQKRKGIISYLFVPDFVGLLPFRKGNHEITVAATVSRGRHSENGFVKV